MQNENRNEAQTELSQEELDGVAGGGFFDKMKNGLNSTVKTLEKQVDSTLGGLINTSNSANKALDKAAKKF